MKQAANILLLLSCFSCASTAENTTSPVLNGFKQAINNVHYLAKVKMTKVESVNQDDETDKHVYFAEVLATYKGKPQQKIRYDMFVEKGEDAVIEPTPVYIALCINEQGKYYWPGTGSIFPTNEAINSWLLTNEAKIQNMPTTASWCS